MPSPRPGLILIETIDAVIETVRLVRKASGDITRSHFRKMWGELGTEVADVFEAAGHFAPEPAEPAAKAPMFERAVARAGLAIDPDILNRLAKRP